MPRMAIRRTSFALGEWYHCYGRGVDKRVVFTTKNDYERFLQSLYLCNAEDAIRRDDLQNKSNQEIFETSRNGVLVGIGAYCLMPNHFHLLLQEKTEGGISRFMQKVGTAYTMYFNIKNDHVGGMFVKPFRSKHVSEDRYFRHVAQYLHLNPAELFVPGWKQGKVNNLKNLEKQLKNYPYSSFAIYTGMKLPEKEIVDSEAFNLLRDTMPPISKVIAEASAYYQELKP